MKFLTVSRGQDEWTEAEAEKRVVVCERCCVISVSMLLMWPVMGVEDETLWLEAKQTNEIGTVFLCFCLFKDLYTLFFLLYDLSKYTIVSI